MRFAAAIALLIVPLAAAAQVYSWKDASGKTHYSDQPPPDRTLSTRRLAPTNTETPDSIAAPKVTAEKQKDAVKQTSEAKEKTAQAEKMQAEDAQRQEACQRSRINLTGIQSGQIRFRMTASGEREALDGAVRDAELADAQRTVDINCAPRPAPAKK